MTFIKTNTVQLKAPLQNNKYIIIILLKTDICIFNSETYNINTTYDLSDMTFKAKGGTN